MVRNNQIKSKDKKVVILFEVFYMEFFVTDHLDFWYYAKNPVKFYGTNDSRSSTPS